MTQNIAACSIQSFAHFFISSIMAPAAARHRVFGSNSCRRPAVRQRWCLSVPAFAPPGLKRLAALVAALLGHIRLTPWCGPSWGNVYKVTSKLLNVLWQHLAVSRASARPMCTMRRASDVERWREAPDQAAHCRAEACLGCRR